MDGLETGFVRQVARNGVEEFEERIGDTVERYLASVCSQLSHPKGRAIIVQSLRKTVSPMRQHRFHRFYLILNNDYSGETYLQSVHRA